MSHSFAMRLSFSLAFFLFVVQVIPLSLKADSSGHGDYVFTEVPKKEAFEFDWGMLTGKGQLKFKPESFYVKYANLLNNNNQADRIMINRSTVDLNFDIRYGSLYYGHDIGEFFVTVRNKATWGNTESIAQTSSTPVKLLDAVFGEHKHFLTRHIMWIRELWFKFSISEAFSLNLKNQHYFMMGAFPFELGRGIALGDAFAVNPRILGFYSDNSVDQYAFGFKFSGDIVDKILTYDLYGAVLENRTDSFTNTSLKIRGQEYGRKFEPQRGSGRVNYIIAGRLRWYPKDDGYCRVVFEPYGLFNDAPEQRIEFIGDAFTRLGTFGMAGEYTYGQFEWGFDSAVNVGHQKLRGIDRNIIEFENRNDSGDVGDNRVVLVNSRVVTEDPTMNPNAPKAIFDRSTPNGRAVQDLINTSAESATQNGKEIGMVDGVTFFNNINRFRDPGVISFKGWMFVADAALALNCDRTVKIAGTFGAASGDENPILNVSNPNASDPDGDFKGFIGLQEIYSGYRVQSVFFLGGVGRAPRPLSAPIEGQNVVDTLPSQISGFTNVVFVGGAMHWNPSYCDRKFELRPNVLAYWQQHATKKFDFETGLSSTENARNFLGLELNTFFFATLFPDCKIFAVGSVFFPGAHFEDIKGTPLNPDDLRRLNRRNRTGVNIGLLQLLNDDVAFTMNLGIECRF